MTADHPFLTQAKRDLERAEIARSKAEALLLAADRDIARLRGFIEQYEFYLSDSEKIQNTIRNRLTTRSLTDVAISIIESSDGPVSIQSILSILNTMGIEVGGENKSANLAAYLSKDNRVRYERGYGWMLSPEALFDNISSVRPKSSSERAAETVSTSSSFGNIRRRYRESHETTTLAGSTRPVSVQADDDDAQI